VDDEAQRQFREFVAARQGALFGAAYLLTGHLQDAEDLLQTALAKLALRWTDLESADAYVRKVLYNQQVSHWRRLGPRREQAWADPPDVVAAGDESGDAVARIALARVLARLTRRQRAVIILRYYEDLPEAEVAQLLGCSVGTVRSQTHRTLARLRELAPDLVSLKES
jgi:RNA polymerase sigma-70 factor (sigma-E family)